MKIIILFSVFAIAVAAPLEGETLVTPNVVPIVKSTQDFQPDGSYRYSFETAEGYVREETGTLVNAGREDAYVAASGLYRYLDRDGMLVEVRYTADTKGFVPRGTGIPEMPVVSTLPELSEVPMPVVPTVPEVSEVPMPVVPTVAEATVVPALPIVLEVPVAVA